MERHDIISRVASAQARLSWRCSDTGGQETRRGDDDLNPGLIHPGPLIKAAVLVGLVERAEGYSVLLTQRTDHLRDHGGQISFPGGRMEAGDVSAEAAALREAEEEIGLPADLVSLIGRLDQYDTRTGFAVTPIVGVVTPTFVPKLDSFEVAEVFEVPLGFILDPENHKRHSRIFEGKTRQFYVLAYEERYIWGATAGMLINLYEVLKV
ncbi:MAG: CoA pyrophosphatase [Alphaproteobacteria bacterium]